jgi:TusA-related sulfurtransferase
MKEDKFLDLSGVVMPGCFFLYKSTLAGMEPGQVLEVSLRDRFTFEDLRTIVNRSRDRVMEVIEEDDRFRLRVRKQAGGGDRDRVGGEGTGVVGASDDFLPGSSVRGFP